MKSKLIVKSAVLILSCMTMTAASYGQEAKMKPSAKEHSATATRKAETGPVKSPAGETFSLTRSHNSQSEFNLIVSDGEERVISGQFSLKQLQLMREIMNEASLFAFSEEAVGKSEPVTTRFSSDDLGGFAVDVSKFENQSQFYITLKTHIGGITVDAGAIRRNEKKQEGFFFDVLARVESQAPASSTQPVK